MKTNFRNKRGGFTLIEILVVIGIIAVLAAIVIVAINPARQFAQARNSQRTSNVNSILNAIGQNIADNKGIFTCGIPVYFSATPLTIAKTGAGTTDLRSCISPTYMPEIPADPATGNNTCTTTACSGVGEDYNTRYTIATTSTSRYVVCAPGGAEAAIASSTAICVTR